MDSSRSKSCKHMNRRSNPILKLCLSDEDYNVPRVRYEDISLAGSSLMYVVDSASEARPRPPAGSSLLYIVDSNSDAQPTSCHQLVKKRDYGVMYERDRFTQEAASDYSPPVSSVDVTSQGSCSTDSVIGDREQRTLELEDHISAIKRTFDAKRWREFKRSLHIPLTFTSGAILASIVVYAFFRLEPG